jgi:hypothetical protein
MGGIKITLFTMYRIANILGTKVYIYKILLNKNINNQIVLMCKI